MRAWESPFDLRSWRRLSDPSHSQVATVAVGAAPVGLAVFDHGSKIAVANSNRVLAPVTNQEVELLDATKIASGSSAVIGKIPAGAFPRELRLSSDDKTLFLTNYNSNTLELIDLIRYRVPIRN